MKKFLLVLHLSQIFHVSFSVKITGLRIPSPYVLTPNRETKPLVLDCVYEEGVNEQGLVLKWYFNHQLIYQWIPATGKDPVSLNLFKNRIATIKNRHRAIEILNPTVNLSGIYSCSVQTFQSMDKKWGVLSMIIPETEFFVTHDADESQPELLHVHCHAIRIYPEPLIRIFIGDNVNNELDVIETISTDTNNQLKNVTVEGRISRKSLKSPTNIFCILSLGAYVKKQQRIFYDSQPYVQEQQPPHAICTEKLTLGRQIQVWSTNDGSITKIYQFSTTAIGFGTAQQLIRLIMYFLPSMQLILF